MKSPLSVSVAMTSCNGARFIGAQMDSLARQDLLPAELVVCDDASDDATFEIVTAFAKRAPFPVRAVRNDKRLGYRANFMKAAGLCQSDIIAFSDQDDIWLPKKLKLCTDAFDADDVLLVYHDATVADQALKPIGTLIARAAPAARNPALSINPWDYALGFTTLFRRQLMDFMPLWPQSVDFHIPQEAEAHDQWFSFLAASLGTTVYLKDHLVLYRQHGGNMYGWHSASNQIIQKLKDILAEGPSDIAARASCCLARATLLEAIQKLSGNSQSVLARQGAERYRKLAERFQMRQEIYRTDNWLTKVGHLARLAGTGGYRSRSLWGLGPKAMIRDIVCGLLLSPQTDAKQKRPAL